MDQTPSYWPSDVTRSFWNYEALQQAPDMPFMGYDLDNQFTLAFAAGAVIIFIFAVTRFNTRTADQHSFRYRVLQELAPMELRRGDLMWWAYIRYAMALFLLYAVLTLFGKITLDALNTLPITGLQVDTSNINFTSPQWPLLISFGMIGVLPMLKPVEVFENRIRAWSHKAAGIPVEIAELTSKVERELDTYFPGERPEDFGVPVWLKKHVASEGAIARVLQDTRHLNLIIDWSRDERAYWPSKRTRMRLERLETEEIARAQDAIDDLRGLMKEDFNRITDPDDELDEDDRAERLDLHRRRLKRQWSEISGRLGTIRDELSAMLVIYAEHDPKLENIRDRKFGDLMDRALRDRYENEGPEYWVAAYILIGATMAFAWAVSNQSQGMFGSVERNLKTESVAVVLEVYRMIAIFLAPLLAVVGLRHYRLSHQSQSWERIKLGGFNQAMMKQIVQSLLLALFVSTILLAAYAVLYFSITAPTVEQMVETISRDDFYNLLFFLTQSSTTVVYIFVVLFAMDAMVDLVQVPRGDDTHEMVLKEVRSKSRWRLLFWGLLGGVGVAVIWSLHINYWFGGYVLKCGYALPQGVDPAASEIVPGTFDGLLPFWSRILGSFGKEDSCYSQIGGTEFILYTLLAFLSASAFISSGQPDDKTVDHRARAARLIWAVVLIGLAVIAYLVWAGKAGAEDLQGDRQQSVVNVGVRAEIEPFSYEKDGVFLGYLPRLCSMIFNPEGSYDLNFVEVTPTNRFDSFKREYMSRGQPLPTGMDWPKPLLVPADQDIHVLCDPTTLRFSSGDGREYGVFSPVVFVSGISYLKSRSTQNTRSRENVYLGYVKGSTARDTALEACESNLFKINTQTVLDEDGNVIEPGFQKADCNIAAASAGVQNALGFDLLPSSTCRPDGAAIPQEARYVFCAFDSHQDAIQWFCEYDAMKKDIERRGFQRAYFGDRDIIRGKFEAFIETHPGCRDSSDVDSATYTYEPYALLIRRDRPDLVQFVQRRVYEIFSDRPVAEALFTGAFEGTVMSKPLASLFVHNAVERVDAYRSGGPPLDELSGRINPPPPAPQ